MLCVEGGAAGSEYLAPGRGRRPAPGLRTWSRVHAVRFGTSHAARAVGRPHVDTLFVPYTVWRRHGTQAGDLLLRVQATHVLPVVIVKPLSSPRTREREARRGWACGPVLVVELGWLHCRCRLRLGTCMTSAWHDYHAPCCRWGGRVAPCCISLWLVQMLACSIERTALGPDILCVQLRAVLHGCGFRGCGFDDRLRFVVCCPCAGCGRAAAQAQRLVGAAGRSFPAPLHRAAALREATLGHGVHS